MSKYTLEPFDLDNATRTLPCGKRVYGFGGSSSSASTTSTTNTDKRLVVDGGGLGISSDSSTVNVTDQGAIKIAGAIASDAIDSSTTNFKTLMDTARLLAGSAANALTKNVELAGQLTTSTQSAYADAASQAQGNKNLVYAGLAVVAMVGFNMIKKG